MPPADWVAAVTPLSSVGRDFAYRALSLTGRIEELGQLMLDVPPRRAPSASRVALQHGMPMPQATASPRDRTRHRQVSVRLSVSAYDDLQIAAEDLGMKPGTLVRTLVTNGVRRVLHEMRRRDAS